MRLGETPPADSLATAFAAGPLVAAFAAGMAGLGPFGAAPLLAVGVSGGADSMALAVLAQDWAAARGGQVLGLTVDHGLRAESGAEAALTATRLAALGIAGQVLRLRGLGGGAGLQERARAARHEALAASCRAAGAVFLLLGHHAGDQAETVAMRAARGPHGLEAMAGWAARTDILLLRPLLGVAPEILRVFLQANGVAWSEDPANANPAFERVRLRQAGVGAASADPSARLAMERQIAAFLAAHVVLRPEGFAVIRSDAAPPRALGALLRAIGGATHAPGLTRTAALAQALRPATLGNVVLARTAKYGGGWLLAREPASCAPAIPAAAGAIWDRRFCLQTGQTGATFGALGAAAAAYRKVSSLPAFVLRGLPCLRRGDDIQFPCPARFLPPAPLSSHKFNA